MLADKRDRLLAVLAAMNRAGVAFSGGVDSAVVAAAAFRALGDRAEAVTGDSPSVPRREIETATRVARAIGIRHRVLRTDEFADPAYVANDGARCYHCKSELYDRLLGILDADVVVCSGANLDDLGDYRPGLRAAAERGVRHPLQEAFFTKADVRALAHEWGLEVADKPASPCLSSRIAPGVEATPERTARVEAAEEYLRGLGLPDCRVRVHAGELARVELPASHVDLLGDEKFRSGLAARLTAVGFQFVTVDLMPLRSGSLNVLVPLGVRTMQETRSADSAD